MGEHANRVCPQVSGLSEHGRWEGRNSPRVGFLRALVLAGTAVREREKLGQLCHSEQ